MLTTLRFILVLATATVGILTVIFPPVELPNTATDFWKFLAYTWLGLAGILAILYILSAILRLNSGIPTSLALLVGGAASTTTATLAQRTDGVVSMIAALSWIILFLAIGGIELLQRSQTTRLS